MLAKITGEATEAHLLPAVTPVTLIVEELIAVVASVVRVSFPAGTLEIVAPVTVQPEKTNVGQEEKAMELKVITFRRVTFAPTITRPLKSQVAALVAALLISQ